MRDRLPERPPGSVAATARPQQLCRHDMKRPSHMHNENTTQLFVTECYRMWAVRDFCAMNRHPSHDWSPNSHCCVNCGCHFTSIEADYRCIPSTDDGGLPTAEEPKLEIDYSAITRGLSA